jgi:hypothetical protein
MKILTVCDEGNNRSVMLAHHLKYWGHDVIPAGVKRNSPDTLALLEGWADRIIVTERGQERHFGAEKVQLWDVGPDVFPRPFNRDLLAVVRGLMDEHRAEYKP